MVVWLVECSVVCWDGWKAATMDVMWVVSMVVWSAGYSAAHWDGLMVDSMVLKTAFWTDASTKKCQETFSLCGRNGWCRFLR